ncbi:MAG: BatD family protein [Alphaproteobacteria bacterium]
MKKILLISVCFWAGNALALEAQLTPNPIMQGESTELVIRSDKPVGVPENLNELTQNFMIAGQQQRQSSQFINGVGSTTYELAFVLFPIHQGETAVPALKIGNEKTEPLTLKVIATGQNKEATQNTPVLELKADVSDTTPYEGQTIFYHLTLTDGQGILDGEIIPAKVENVRLSPIGQDKVDSVIKEGKRVTEISRSYILTPDKAGPIEMAPALFNGQVAYKAQRPSSKHKFFGFADAGLLFDGFLNTNRPVSFSSNPVVINVRAKPTDIKGWWLPSPKVRLSAEYQIPPIVQVGDTLSGQFILTAQDVNASDMPIPRLNGTNDFRIYPQPEERSTTLENGHLLGKVRVPFMLIPLKAGQTEIPEVGVDWFNTITQKAERAVIPARPLKVEQGSVAPVIGPVGNASAPPKKETPSPEMPQSNWVFFALSGLAGLALGALAVFSWFRYKNHSKAKKEKPLPDFYPFK